MNKKINKELLKLVKKAAKKNEVPVGALIVCNNKIISKAYNKRYTSKLSINHAEVIAILKAQKKLKDWRLSNCDIYVTLKPCEMCSNIIEQSRIKNVYYILDKNVDSKEYYKTKYEQLYVNNYNDFKAILSNFFKKMR